MTMTPFTCDDFSEGLAGYLERDAAPGVMTAMDSHAAACRACAELLQELAAITSEAAALPELVPARDLWAGIAARIDAPVIPIGVAPSRQAGTANPGRRRWWAHPAVAAAALVGITAGVTYYMTKQSIEQPVAAPGIAVAPTVDGAGATVDAVPSALLAEAGGSADGGQAVEYRPAPGAPDGQRVAPAGQRAVVPRASSNAGGGEVQLAAYRPGETAALDSLYYREIIRLRQLLDERSVQLDTSTVAVINRNMLVIDRAIQECREALAADPASKFLNQQLNQALETKIELLRTAAMMPVGS